MGSGFLGIKQRILFFGIFFIQIKILELVGEILSSETSSLWKLLLKAKKLKFLEIPDIFKNHNDHQCWILKDKEPERIFRRRFIVKIIELTNFFFNIKKKY